MLWNVLLRSMPLNGVVAYCKDRECRKRNAIRTLEFAMTFGPIEYGKCALAVREGRPNMHSPHGPHTSIASGMAKGYEYDLLSFRKSECLMSTNPLPTCVQRSGSLLVRYTLQCEGLQRGSDNASLATTRDEYLPSLRKSSFENRRCRSECRSAVSAR